MSEFSIRDTFPVLLRLWHSKWIILLVTLSGLLAGVAVAAGLDMRTNYRATSSVFVTYTTYQEQVRGSSVITNYSGLVTSLLVCERAAEIAGDTELTAKEIQRMVANWSGSNSHVMYIQATADTPQTAILVSNAVAQAFTEKVSTVSGSNALQVLDVAYTAETLVSSPDVMIVLFGAVPCLIVCAAIAIKEILEGKIRLLSQCAPDPEELLAILPDVK